LVGLVVDHPQRDLPGLVLVAYELAGRGVDVALIPLNLLGPEAFALAPDFLLLNYLRRNIDGVLSGCLDAGIPYGILDTEGGFYGDLDAYGLTFTRRRELRDGVRLFCVWGRRTREYLEANALVPVPALVTTGVPRFDFYAPAWRRFYNDVDLRIPVGDLVLVNTKIAVANPQHHSIEEEIRLYTDKLGMPLDEVLRHRDIGIATIEGVTALCNRLARDEPALQVVIRPHPHERLATYEDRVDADTTNLHVIRRGTVDPWIVRSLALIHRQCTTAIEARLAGIPAIAPMWIPTSANAPDTEAVSVACDSYDDLRRTLDAVRAGEDVVPDSAEKELRRIVDDWLFAVDGLSHVRVADAIATRAQRVKLDETRLERSFFRSRDAITSVKGVAGRVARVGYHASRRSPRWARLAHPASGTWTDGAKAFSVQEVAACMAAIDHAHGASPSDRGGTVVSATAADRYRFGYRGHAVLIAADAM
jgi:surface carbohydrate biosynthesis protein